MFLTGVLVSVSIHTLNLLIIRCNINSFTPEFLEWAHPSMNLNAFIVANRGYVKINNELANSVYPDETARYEPSHLDIHCL